MVITILRKRKYANRGVFLLFIYGHISGGFCIHYLVAKIGGTFIFGRGWCGYACWTMAILDLLPFGKQPKEGRVAARYVSRYAYTFSVL